MHKYLALFLILVSAEIMSQNISGMLNLNPYPSPYVSDWENNPSALGALTVYNSGGTAAQIRIRAAVTMQGKGTVFSSITKAIDLTMAPVQILNNTTLVSVANASFNSNDFKNKILQTGRFPEGYYTACITMENLNGAVLSSGICANFTIIYPAPPNLITPADQELLAPETNYPSFQWTPVVVPPAFQIKYTLRIVEVLQGQTPSQAINANIPVFEDNQLIMTAFTYPISGFPLEEDKRYAWQVQALDQYGFPPAQNLGRSEIFTFIKKKKPALNVFTNVLLVAPSSNGVINIRKPEFKWLYSVNERMKVKYNLLIAPVNAGQSNEQALNNTPVFNQTFTALSNSYTPATDINFTSTKDYVWQLTVLNSLNNTVVSKSSPWKLTYKTPVQVVVKTGGGTPLISSWSSLSGTLKYKFSGSGETEQGALANKTVKLVLKYVMKIKSHTGPVYNAESPKGTIVLTGEKEFGSDADKILDIRTTDSQGNFKFTFINPDSMGLVKKNYSFGCTKENCFMYIGDVYRVARILVDDKYYLSPDDDILVQPWENKVAGSFTSAVKSYSLDVTIKPSKDSKYSEQYTHQALNEMDVYILRKSRPFNLPSTEGFPKAASYFSLPGFEVIATGKTGQYGTIQFKRLIVNLNPADNYYLYAMSNQNAPHNYKAFLGAFKFDYTKGLGDNQYKLQNNFIEHLETYTGGIVVGPLDNSTFNAQYTYPLIKRNFYAVPLLPEILGRVVRSDNGKSIPNVEMSLMKMETMNMGYAGSYSYPVVERSSPKPGPDGDFKYSNLSVVYNSSGAIAGPERFIWISAPGFQIGGYDVNGKGVNGALTMGQRVNMGNLTINPGAVAKGIITDEFGHGISAKVKIGDSNEKTVNTGGVIYDPKSKTYKTIPGDFSIPVAKLNYQKLVVTPLYNQSSYIIDTTYVNIDQDIKDLGTIKLFKKLHRITITVYEESTLPFYQWQKVAGAKVKIEGLGSYYQKTTASNGVAEFSFSNDALHYKVIVEAPDGKYYEKRVGNVYNAPSKYIQNYDFSLKKATYIAGKVFVADTKPVSGADVWIDYGNPDMNIYTKTNSYGEFMLRNVPANKRARVFASKNSADTTIIGDSIHVMTKDPGTGLVGQNLYLTIYNGMDITTLLGFPVLLTDLVESAGTVKITGVIKQFKENGMFTVFDTVSAKLNFHNIVIVPGTQLNTNGIPVAKLSSLPMQIDNPDINLKVFGKFKLKLGDLTEGLVLDEYKTSTGTIKGKGYINSSSFNTQGSITDYTGFYLAVPGSSSNKMLLSTVTADGKNPVQLTNGYNVVNSTGGGLSFKINTFTAEADPNLSYLNYDTVRLNTTLHTNIQTAVPSDINLKIGDVVFHQNSIDPLNSEKPFSFTLGKWTLNASKWYFNKGYLTISEGMLKTGADIPVKSLAITPSTFMSPQFDFKSLLVSGTAPLTITGNVSFDYNSYKKYWYLSVNKKPGETYSAYFKELPGMEPGTMMKISNFEMNSGQSFFTMNPLTDQKMTIFRVGLLGFSYGALMAYDDYLYIPGLSFDIPNVSQSTGIEYYKEGGKTAFRMKGININTNSGKGVYLKFGVNEEQQNSQKLDNSGFRSRGVTGEQGKFELNTWLFHTVDSTYVLVETPSTPFSKAGSFQALKIGASKTSMSDVTGGMKVVSKAWDYFRFSGDLTGTKGITDNNKRLNFTVYGNIEADNQQVSIKDIPTPFGAMKWTYQFENSRLIGTMGIHQDMGGIKVDGNAEMLIDGSGWYFLGGGTMQVPGVGPGYAAVLFGDYPSMTPSVKEKFAAASYKKSLPSGFQSAISGFLLSGALSVPVIIPHIGFDLEIVSAEFGVDAGGDIKIYKGFEQGASTYGLSALGFVHAFLNMDAITCTDLSADFLGELGFEGSYFVSTGTFNLDGCMGFKLAANLTQKLWACDLDGCGCMGTIFDKGFSFPIKATMHLDSGGNKSFGFSTGTCSGN